MLPVGFSCFPDHVSYYVTYESNTLLVKNNVNNRRTTWYLYQQSEHLKLEWPDSYQGRPDVIELLAALEAAFGNFPQQRKLSLSVPVEHLEELIESGILIPEANQFSVYVEIFWQLARMWHSPDRRQAFPIRYVFSQGKRHPLRPPKPKGTVYQRYIMWLGRDLTFRTVNPATDLGFFNRWMNDPIVAKFWQEEGNLAKHTAYLEAIQADPHVINLISYLGDEPFGYFEIYWAKENRIAPYYEVDDFDRGWHVLIGEPSMRGRPFVTAWLPSISHYLFLNDDRTQRIVIEPRVDNSKMIRNLMQCGYASLKEFDFPHKRAMLCMLLRERFFSEQLWLPRNTTLFHSSHSVCLS